MAAFINETPAQFERDLRSANKEWKRGKDANVKWSYGGTDSRAWWSSTAIHEVEDSTIKIRPVGKPSDA